MALAPLGIDINFVLGRSAGFVRRVAGASVDRAPSMALCGGNRGFHGPPIGAALGIEHGVTSIPA